MAGRLLLLALLLTQWTEARGQSGGLRECFADAGDRTLFEGCECFERGTGSCEESPNGMQVNCEAPAAKKMTEFPRPGRSYPEIACL